MKKNISQNFLFTPNTNFFDDVNCLLTFVKQPLRLDKFFKKIPSDILKTKLKQLNFIFNNGELQINLKTTWKNKKISLTNEIVSTSEIILPNKNQFIEKLTNDKFLEPELTFEESLNKIIGSYTKKIINLNINDTINLIQERNLQIQENRAEKVQVRLFFIFLKIFMQNILLNNTHFIFSELIENSVSSTRLFASGINNFIIPLSNDLTFAEEPTEKSAKDQQEININEMVFSYDLLLKQLGALSPNSDETNIKQLLNSIIEISLDSKLISKYNFFKQTYYAKKGFISLFGHYNDNGLIQACLKKLAFKKINEDFLQLIEELTTHEKKIPEIMNLVHLLQEKTDIYFQSLKYNSMCNKLEPNAIAFENFKLSIKNEISNFQKKYLCPIEVNGIFNKILNTLGKCVPSFLLSKEKRISFFQKKMPEVKLLVKIENSISSLKV